VAEAIFQDRRDAGRVLAEAVLALPDLKDAVVLGLARGGVPVAFEVALACDLPLDVLIVRKLGVPRYRELAMGAFASGGAVVLNPDILEDFRISEQALHEVIHREKIEMERLEAIYREGLPAPEFGRDGVILVDDGLATGATMRAAVLSVRPRASRVTIAVPVAVKSTCNELAGEVDHMICAAMPERLEAVSLFYREFAPTSDEEVRALLSESRKRIGSRSAAQRDMRTDPEH
jgi:putative phosphoribosyl transferase